MSQLITFFRPRQGGSSYAFTLKSSKAEYRVFLYSRIPLDNSLVGTRKVDELDAEMERLARAIGPEGILVRTEERETLRFALLASGSADTLNCGVLQPGSPLTVQPFARNKTIEGPLGTRLLVPVDREAVDRLLSLEKDLAWLSPDLEALILNAIGKPGLEVRVSRLEAKDPRRGGESGSGWMGRLRERFGRVPLWPVVSFLLLLMLGLNAYLFHFLTKKIDAIKPSQTTATGSGGGATRTGAAAAPPPPAFQQKILEIGDALRAQQGQGQGSDLDNLYAAHFSTLKTVDDVASDLKKEKERQSLALGLMKLEALRIDRAGGASLIGVSNDYGKLKEFFKAHLKDQPEASVMVAALGCEAYKVPGLPYQKLGGVKSAAFLAGTKKDCTGSSLKDAVPGLEQLIAFIKNPDGTS